MKRCLNCMELIDDEYDVCPYCGFVEGTPPEIINHLYPGMKLNNGRYIVGTVSNFGGFGVVYRAWDTQLEIMVAIKECFPPNLVTRTSGEARVALLSGGIRRAQFLNQMGLLLEEAKNTAQFGDHPNIVNVFTRFEDNGTAYMVMEYMEGVTLKEYLKQNNGKLDVDTTITILLSVIKALKEVHKRGMLHRDIAPDNIFILQNGTVKLFDFGAGKFADEDKNLQRENVVKPGYTPPEQYDDKSTQGPWTDIYALAATMYRCITGIVPDESTNRKEALYNKEPDTVKALHEVDKFIPEYIDSSLMRAMSVTPKFRFQSVNEFEEAILNKKTFRSEEEERKFLLRRRLISVACVGLVILAGALYALMDYNNKKKAAELEEASITVWMPVDEDGEEIAKKEFEGMTAEFAKVYPQVKLEVSYVGEEVYEEQLSKAFIEGNAPTVFDADFVTDDMSKNLEELDDVVDLLNLKEYFFLKNYKKICPDKNMLPTGFSVPVIYGNSNLMKTGEIQNENSREKYIGKENSVYIAGSDQYAQIQEELPGVYEVMPLLDETPKAYTIDLWGVNAQCSRAQKNAGKRLLYYFLGENAQDVFYLQHAEGLPLNKTMFMEYIEVNAELYFLEDYVKNVNAEIMTETEREKYFKQLYKDEFKEKKNRLDELEQWLEEGE